MSERALVDNSADSQQIRKARKIQRRTLDQQKKDLEAVLALPAGRRVLRDYIAFCGLFKAERVSSDDQHFNAGMRNVGLKMLHDAERARPDLISILKDTTAS